MTSHAVFTIVTVKLLTTTRCRPNGT